jgi:hypothetical protein
MNGRIRVIKIVNEFQENWVKQFQLKKGIYIPHSLKH